MLLGQYDLALQWSYAVLTLCANMAIQDTTICGDA